jgi:hypothetical protein
MKYVYILQSLAGEHFYRPHRRPERQALEAQFRRSDTHVEL